MQRRFLILIVVVLAPAAAAAQDSPLKFARKADDIETADASKTLEKKAADMRLPKDLEKPKAAIEAVPNEPVKKLPEVKAPLPPKEIPIAKKDAPLPPPKKVDAKQFKQAKGPIPNPDQFVRLAAAWVATEKANNEYNRIQAASGGKDRKPVEVSEYDLRYVRFVHWCGESDETLADTKLAFGVWLNQMSFSRATAQTHEVASGNGRLQWLDMRDYRWNADAWHAVALREPYTQQPWVFNQAAEYLRRELHLPLRFDANSKEFPVEAVMSAPWLFRETLEGDRSPSYYDLLYAERRFVTGPGVKTETKVVNHKGGDFLAPDGKVRKNLPAGEYKVEYAIPGQAKKTDFPANLNDWEEAFGIDVIRTFGKNTNVKLEFGAVVEGGADNPRQGSIVALHNRLLVTIQAPFGWTAQSFDVFAGAGNKNFFETSAKLPFLANNKKVPFEAGELFAMLPNKGLATMLIDGQANRAEVAASKAASAAMIEKRLNAGVRNPGDCILCHSPSGGYIEPRNLVEVMKSKGLDTNIRDKQEYLDYLGFYFDWKILIDGFRAPYNDLINRSTSKLSLPELVAARLAGKKVIGWDGARFARAVHDFRDRYDDPLGVEECAAWIGCSPAAMLDLAAKSTSADLNALHFDRPIPRRTWELEVYRIAALQLAASRGK